MPLLLAAGFPRKCPPSFPCGYLGDVSFPFTKAERQDCGFLPIRNCDDPLNHKMIQPQKNGTWFQVIRVTQLLSNPTTPFTTFQFRDEDLYALLQNQSCEAFRSNYTLPHTSPFASFSFAFTTTLFRCNRSLPFNPPTNMCNYTKCHDYNLYFGYNHSSSLTACTEVKLPNKDVPDGINPFAFLTADVLIKVELTHECLDCINRQRGLCQLDSTEKFCCANKGGQLESRDSYSDSSSNPHRTSSGEYFEVPLFSYAQLKEVTNNFDHTQELGDGGFGTVYYGKLPDGREVAVKRLYEHNWRRVEQFKNEVKILTRLRHKNLVSLYGCTSRHSRELLLVYEYISNGTVACHLHGDLAKPGLLPWPTRIKIAIETASALAYLHASRIIHRDVKTNNILLDSNFSVKVADFGLSRDFRNDVTHVSTAPQGSPGYLDPEYYSCYQLTSKSDVYSFGVVLIELISSKPAVDMNRSRDEINLSNLAVRKIQESAIGDLVDPCLGFDSDSGVKGMIVSVAGLALQCLQREKDLRPSMDEVLHELQRIKSGKDEVDVDNVRVSDSCAHSPPPASPEWDEVGLLKNTKPASPNSVTDKWESITQQDAISISDEDFHKRFQNNSCDTLTNNYSLPSHSQLYSINIKYNVTLFRCKHGFNKKPPPHYFSYPCPQYHYDIYYDSLPLPNYEETRTLFSSCSVLQLAKKDKTDTKDILSFVSAAMVIEVVLSNDCYECYNRRGGQCRLDNDQKFYCQQGPRNRSKILKLILGLVADPQYQSRNTQRGEIGPISNPEPENGRFYYEVPLFSYKELKEATYNFHHARQLGSGGFGTVYYGKLRDGREVAIKRLYEHNYRRVEQFMNEVHILTGLRHINLVSLYGCTSGRSRELLLVYEHVPNGTVACHLHGAFARPRTLPWQIRMKIAIETASALSYLHASAIIHRDVKTKNILLTQSFSVKVGDFGLSRLFPNDVTHVSTAPLGTPGYVDPEYQQCYQLTNKSDVYSFGVVLIELISSKPAVDMSRNRDEINLSNLAIKKIQQSAFSELVDSSLGFDSDSEVKRMMVSVAELAFQCLQRDKDLRPSMDEVLKMLTRIESGKDTPEHLDEEDLSLPSLPSPPPLDWDENGLWKKMMVQPSPKAVTDKWHKLVVYWIEGISINRPSKLKSYCMKMKIYSHFRSQVTYEALQNDNMFFCVQSEKQVAAHFDCGLLLLVSAENGECPRSFQCGFLGQIRFPFTTTQQQHCGLLPIHGCENHDPMAPKTLQLNTSTTTSTSYPVLKVEVPHTIFITDVEHEKHLLNRSCKAFGKNFSLPHPSPSASFLLKYSITIFRCPHSLKPTLPKYFHKYSNCSSEYDIYYGRPDAETPLDLKVEKSLAPCSTIQLAVEGVSGDDPFQFLTSSIAIEVELSDECERCPGDGKGQCLPDGKGNFSCPTESANIYFGVPVFTYRDLEIATKSFDRSRELGEGGFGIVYFGKLQDGREVAVKRLYEHNYRRVEQFLNEIKILTRLRHKNLVSLYGCTSRDSRELLLVYEYISNGTVASHLHHHESTNHGSMTWPTRMKVAIETATALAHLHARDIIHRDVKTSNLLLDSTFCVKVADFGLSRLFPIDVTHVSTAPQGTPGYVDPEYHRCYQLTNKSDVYSFGVVLIELISSMPAIDLNRHKDEINLADLAMRKIHKNAIAELVDPSLGFESNDDVKRQITAVAELAFQCLQRDKELRPSMEEVLEVLKRIESGKEETRHVEEVNLEDEEPPSPSSADHDEVKLLMNIKLPPSSPKAVTDKWSSQSTSPNVSGQ
ncbi:unnamed protein product [Sphenostylis stenocarpa]|uniref:Protein kinase domain-containing protein n=1 Tax=Sphenostylis stenocarpa TaxID=92480 RepID=A0AA87B7S2_9FABA|nr:unnamed protein product [Sphenostylis stenocarpa]